HAGDHHTGYIGTVARATTDVHGGRRPAAALPTSARSTGRPTAREPSDCEVSAEAARPRPHPADEQELTRRAAARPPPHPRAPAGPSSMAARSRIHRPVAGARRRQHHHPTTERKAPRRRSRGRTLHLA